MPSTCICRRLLLLISLTLASHVQRAHAIVQGTLDSGNTYGKVCALLQADQSGGYNARCSAVLINPSMLLTAAHCAGGYARLVPVHSTLVVKHNTPEMFTKKAVDVSTTTDRVSGLSCIVL